MSSPVSKLDAWRTERREPEREAAYGRSPFEVDRDRILYSGHFLRLAEVTQTVSPIHGYVFHNRLSHSLKVGNVSRRIAEYLLREGKVNSAAAASLDAGHGLDATVAELAGFAHDLGHPPFGHVAEELLGTLAHATLQLDSFEGNAQTFRILDSLAAGDVARVTRERGTLGLNLTRASINAVCKYPWCYDSDESPKSKEKFGYYATEKATFQWARSGLAPGVRTLEAAIMDWADDVTFSIHDLMDFYSAGQIPLHLYVTSPRNEFSIESNIFIKYIVDDPAKKQRFERLVNEVRERMPSELPQGQLDVVLSDFLRRNVYDWFGALSSRYTGSPAQREAIAAVTSDGINRCIAAVSLDSNCADNKPDGVFRINPNTRLFVELLKQFTWHYVIDGQALTVDQVGYREAVEKSFNALDRSIREPRKAFIFPAHIRTRWEDQLKDENKREIIDYIASMSEPELMRFYKQIMARNSY